MDADRNKSELAAALAAAHGEADEGAIRALMFYHTYESQIRGMLHHINNRMQGVSYAVPMLVEDPDTISDSMRTMAGVGATETMTALQDLTTLLRMAHDVSHPVSPGGVVQGVCTWAGYHRHGQADAFDLQLDADLPAVAGPAHAIHACLSSLINNQLERGDPNELSTMVIGATAVDDAVRFRVTQAGGDQPQPDWLVWGSTTKEGHPGLGLPLTAMVARRCGGRLEITPDPPGFDLYWPAVSP